MEFSEQQDREFAEWLTSLDATPDATGLKDVIIEHRIIGRLHSGNGNTACEAYNHRGAVAHWRVRATSEGWAPGKNSAR